MGGVAVAGGAGGGHLVEEENWEGAEEQKLEAKKRDTDEKPSMKFTMATNEERTEERVIKTGSPIRRWAQAVIMMVA